MGERLAQRVLLVGWDGAEWNIIRPLMRQGRMPNLTRLIESGVLGSLASVQPLLSPILWTCVATGKRPQKHGILGDRQIGSDGLSIRLTSSIDRKVPAIWNLLSACGLRTHCINWAASHPAEAINGICLSTEFLRSASPAAQSIYPPELASTVAPLRVSPPQVNPLELLSPAATEPIHPPAGANEDTRITLCRYLLAQSATVHAATTWALEDQPWDFAAVLYPSIEHASQGFMAYHSPRQPHLNQGDYDRYHSVVDRVYEFHDMMLGRLIELAGPETTVMVVSDHGFRTGLQRHPFVPRSAEESSAIWHRPQGIFVASGSNLRRDDTLEGASILDITPTILMLFGLPIGRDMDGQPLTGAIDHPVEVEFRDSWNDPSTPEPASPPPLRPSTTGEIDHLLALGYGEAARVSPTLAERRVEQVRDENRYNLARALLDSDQPADASKLLEALVAKDPDHPGYNAKLLDSLYEQARWTDARRIADSLWHRGHQNARVLQAFATIDAGERRYTSALAHLQQAEKAYTESGSNGTEVVMPPDMYVMFGDAYLPLARYTEAENAYGRALAMDEQLETAWNGRAVAALALGRPAESLAYCRRAVAIRPDLADAHFNMGMAIAALGNRVDAIRCLQRSIVLKPDVLIVYRRLIELCKSEPTIDPAMIQNYQARMDDLAQRRRLARQGVHAP